MILRDKDVAPLNLRHAKVKAAIPNITHKKSEINSSFHVK